MPLAVQAAGLVSVPVNWRMSAPELANVVAASDAALPIHDEALAGLAAAAALNGLPDARCPGRPAERRGAAARFRRRPEGNDEALASIHFTSSTLGTPIEQNLINGRPDHRQQSQEEKGI